MPHRSTWFAQTGFGEKAAMPAGCVCDTVCMSRTGLGCVLLSHRRGEGAQPRAAQSPAEAGTAPARLHTCQSHYEAVTRALKYPPLYGPPALASSDIVLQQDYPWLCVWAHASFMLYGCDVPGISILAITSEFNRFLKPSCCINFWILQQKMCLYEQSLF